MIDRDITYEVEVKELEKILGISIRGEKKSKLKSWLAENFFMLNDIKKEEATLYLGISKEYKPKD